MTKIKKHYNDYLFDIRIIDTDFKLIDRHKKITKKQLKDIIEKFGVE